jgi:hypothetical protein
VVCSDPLFAPLLAFLQSDTCTSLLESFVSSATERESLFLVAHLLFHRWIGHNSPFQGYLSTIPEHYSTTCFWPREVLECIEGSALFSASHTRHDELVAMHGVFAHATSAWDSSFSSFCNFQQFLWATTTLDSRGFRVLVDGEATTVLAPLADMLNHSFQGQIVSKRFDSHRRELLLSAQGPIEPGELLTSYGELDNGRLLLFYGFCDEDNPHDRVELQLELPDGDPLAEAKMAALSALGGSLACSVGPGCAGVAAAVAVLRVLLLPDSPDSSALLAALCQGTAPLEAVAGYPLGPIYDAASEAFAVDTLCGVLSGLTDQAVTMLARSQCVPPSQAADSVRSYARSQLSIAAEAAAFLGTCGEVLRAL